VKGNKKFITIKDIEDSLRAKEQRNYYPQSLYQNIGTCNHPVKNHCNLGYGYIAVICANCVKTLRLYRKNPTQAQKELFQKFEIEKAVNRGDFFNDSKNKQNRS